MCHLGRMVMQEKVAIPATYPLHTHYIHSPIFSRHLATFTSPAKGVGWGDWREGSSRDKP